ncbi:hypothetical protein [Terracidiphilus sp.]|jgi:ppGpp synthetase/RelA/SpoT-type nucleotidyltranferase|uniref:hypothetical protein n=1 Tax=Terracidiphilus sp. TaxID=1964191 RepID=UPI003C1B98BA
MTEQEKITSRLRQEYLDLLPEIRRVLAQVETEIRFYTLPVLHSLNPYEKLVIQARVKECESAVESLRNDQEGKIFDPERGEDYSLRNLPDLAGVRILAFPDSRLIEVDNVLREHFPGWLSKPVQNENGSNLAPKYFGYRNKVSQRVRGEYQIVPMLLGLFWEVEHAAMYKFKPIANSKEMRGLRADVESALFRFEKRFASFVADSMQPSSEDL